METNESFNTRMDIFQPLNVLKIVGCFIFVSLAIWMMFKGFFKTETANAVLELRSEIIGRDFRINRFDWNCKDGDTVVVAELENISNYQYLIVGLELEYLDESSSILGKKETIKRKVMPGDKWEINEIAPISKVNKVRIKEYYGTRDLR